MSSGKQIKITSMLKLPVASSKAHSSTTTAAAAAATTTAAVTTPSPSILAGVASTATTSITTTASSGCTSPSRRDTPFANLIGGNNDVSASNNNSHNDDGDDDDNHNKNNNNNNNGNLVIKNGCHTGVDPSSQCAPAAGGSDVGAATRSFNSGRVSESGGGGGGSCGSGGASSRIRRKRSLRERSEGGGTTVTPTILGRNRSKRHQSPQETPQKRQSREPASSLEAITPESSIMNKYGFYRERPYAIPATLRWTNGADVWSMLMMKKSGCGVGGGTANMTRILQRNPAFKPQMRAILLDWLIEVSEVYNQHRDTYYLAMNLFDRYLDATENLPKEQLQLVGVACLFIAGKMEEIYPPQIKEYSYVSDGACEERQIIAKELAILTVLKWDICPMTANNWLTLLFQLANTRPSNGTDMACSSSAVAATSSSSSSPAAAPTSSSSSSSSTSSTGAAANDSAAKDLLKPNVNLQDFNVGAQLLDLCTLDMESVTFAPLHLAAAVVSHVLGESTMRRVSGLKSDEVADCRDWMVPFVKALREQSPSKNVWSTEFNKQAYNVNLNLLERAHAIRAKMQLEQQQQQLLQAKLLASNHTTNTNSGTGGGGGGITGGNSSAPGHRQGAAAAASSLMKTPTSTRKRSVSAMHSSLMTPPSMTKQPRLNDENLESRQDAHHHPSSSSATDRLATSTDAEPSRSHWW